MAELRDLIPASVLRQLEDEGYAIVRIEGYEADTTPALQGEDSGEDSGMNAKESFALEERVAELAARIVALEERVYGKDMSAELLGEPVDHTEERAERAAMARRLPANAPHGPLTKPSGPRA